MNPVGPVTGLRFLRPYLCKDVTVARKLAYLRFFSLTRPSRALRTRNMKNLSKVGVPLEDGVEFHGGINERMEELKAANALEWPRIKRSPMAMTTKEFLVRYKDLRRGEHVKDDLVLIRGRLRSFRVAGKGLAFLDVAHDRVQIQAVCNLSKLDAFSGVGKQRFKDFYHLIRRGDIICKICVRVSSYMN